MNIIIRINTKLIIVTFMIFLFIAVFVVLYITNNGTLQSASSNVLEQNEQQDELEEKKDYIKWVDCNLTLDVLEKTSKFDIDSHNNDSQIKYNWIELIAYLGCKYGNNFNSFKQNDLNALIEKLDSGIRMEEIAKDFKYYDYYYESYYAILKEFIGEYTIEVETKENEKQYETKYGIKAFLPIAKGFDYSHYDDFGASRSYGFKRNHLGNDLMGSIGTPIIAVESGIIGAVRLESIWWMENWNQKL